VTGLEGLKRLVANASLQRKNIVTATEMFDFCKAHIQGIDFVLIKSEDINVLRENMKERLSAAITIPGTRSFHQFTPISPSVIAAKKVSEDLGYSIHFDFKLVTVEDEIPIQLAKFIVCTYDDKHWLGMVMELDRDNADVQVKFMNPHLPSTSFKWPVRDDVCWVPKPNVLCVIDAPVLQTATGRNYQLKKNDMSKIQKLI
jgi:hypothetical protein